MNTQKDAKKGGNVPAAPLSSPLPTEHEILGKVLDKTADFLKKKDYEFYREAMNTWEAASLAPDQGPAFEALVLAVAHVIQQSDLDPEMKKAAHFMGNALRDCRAALKLAQEAK